VSCGPPGCLPFQGIRAKFQLVCQTPYALLDCPLAYCTKPEYELSARRLRPVKSVNTDEFYPVSRRLLHNSGTFKTYHRVHPVAVAEDCCFFTKMVFATHLRALAYGVHKGFSFAGYAVPCGSL
jgi:hypothetical protein